LAFVIGTDQLATLHLWHRFPELLNLCHWIVLNRKSDSEIHFDVEAAIAHLRNRGLAEPDSTHAGLWRLPQTSLLIVDTPPRALSSTEMRLACERTGTPPENSLNPRVEEYLKQNHLYGTQSVKK